MIEPILTPGEVQILSRARQHNNVLALSEEITAYDALAMRGYLHKDTVSKHAFWITYSGREALVLHAIHCQIEAAPIGDVLIFELDTLESAKRVKMKLSLRYQAAPGYWLKFDWIKKVGDCYRVKIQKLKVGGGS